MTAPLHSAIVSRGLVLEGLGRALIQPLIDRNLLLHPPPPAASTTYELMDMNVQVECVIGNVYKMLLNPKWIWSLNQQKAQPQQQILSSSTPALVTVVMSVFLKCFNYFYM